jgi:hypothetical protein
MIFVFKMFFPMSYTLKRVSFLSIVLLITGCLTSASLMAQQVPQAFPYQGVARDGDKVVTGTVGLQFQIRQGSLNGPSVYQEEVSTETNPEGVFAVYIGEANSATFNQIDWAQGPYFLQVGLDPLGGVSYSDLGTTPILSVPYALYAESAGAAVTAVKATVADSATMAGTALDDLDRDPTNEIQSLSLNGQQLSLSKVGGSVTLPPAPVYTAGTGISISNNIITNAAPAVNPMLTLNGQTLSVGPGGNSVVLPVGGGSNWTVSGSNIARTTGNVGIGTAFPTSKLTVQTVISSLNPGGLERTRISASLGDAGYFETYGPNGSSNVRISNHASFPNNGYLTIYNANGDSRVQLFAGSNDVGYVYTQGQNEFLNSAMTHLSNYSNNGYIGVLDAWGEWKAGIFVNASGNGQLFTDPGGKNFRMEHPDQPGKDILYCSLEGPEAGVYDRGNATLKDGEAFVSYRDHFLLVMNPETVTVTLTPREWDTYGLAVIETTDRGFRVRELKNGKGNFSFFWEVKGIIRGHEDYRVIRDRSESMPARSEAVSDKLDDKSR